MKKSKHSLETCGLSDGTSGQPFGSCDDSCGTKQKYTKRKVRFRISIDTSFYAKSEKQKRFFSSEIRKYIKETLENELKFIPFYEDTKEEGVVEDTTTKAKVEVSPPIFYDTM